MKMTTRLLLVTAWLLAAQASAQDPVKLSPTMYTVLLDNPQVRVLEFHAKPGEKEPMHSHPAAVVYMLTAGKATFLTADGKSEEREWKAGTAIWSDPTTHAYQYVGPTEGRVLIVELKGGTKQ